ncbi:MAG TPA: alpha/beta hydrolase [Pseudonocardiaceae bacterium]|jgi:pimeloyl-ACP methyl ester carboxylesterase|nr:alpha/beta hydrolase [Pseudonocardiaceae bacterium]
MTDFVLVHGTTQAPSCWDRVSHALTRRGHRALAVDLPVDQPDLLVEDYARIAADQVAGDVREPVVVAHSGGGLVASALGRRLGAAHLVWLAAFVPDFAGGLSMLDQVTADRTTMFGAEWPEWRSDDPTESAYFLFHGCDLATLRWAVGTLRPWRPTAAYGEAAGPAPDVPSTYVLPLADRTLTPAWMRAAATDRLGVVPIEVDGDHCPHIARSELVAGLLAGVSRAV